MFTHCDNNMVLSILPRIAVLDPSEVLGFWQSWDRDKVFMKEKNHQWLFREDKPSWFFHWNLSESHVTSKVPLVLLQFLSSLPPTPRRWQRNGAALGPFIEAAVGVLGMKDLLVLPGTTRVFPEFPHILSPLHPKCKTDPRRVNTWDVVSQPCLYYFGACRN